MVRKNTSFAVKESVFNERAEGLEELFEQVFMSMLECEGIVLETEDVKKMMLQFSEKIVNHFEMQKNG